MGGEVSAADGALQRGAKIVNQSKVDIVGELNAIQNKLSGIGSSWTGSGAAAFQQTFQAWQDKSRRITNALDQFEQNLIDSQSAYTQTDDTSKASHNKFMGRLG
ncbi:WXG100 family type VII secretion target [Microbacterium sp. ARD32]|uniref:WXG100 family type VII secretion target n=1 Tax=Microbacterium sp. ARD32 TaxID=2962577 RepID=UPI0028822ACC|nr:WXG100 family type VII secretion target [Microbacterium sp. ARD32]MDT0156138.1 WXG100 family type VII secretion target [Microbacterium sp. ARD32]